MDNSRGAFIKAATDMGISKSAAKTMADAYGLSKDGVNALSESIKDVPPSKVVKISAETEAAKNAVATLQSRINALRGNSVTITTRYVKEYYSTGGGQNKQGGTTSFAAGGMIRGPGTGTSDDVLMYGSNGEFMQKAAAVDKYGERFMHAVNNMTFPAHLARGYAAGGPIVPNYAPRSTMGQFSGGGGARGGNLAGIEISGTLDTPFGPAHVRGVVREETAKMARTASVQSVRR